MGRPEQGKGWAGGLGMEKRRGGMKAREYMMGCVSEGKVDRSEEGKE